MTERYSKITGWGKHFPTRVLTNADLEKMVEEVGSPGQRLLFAGGSPPS